MADAVIVSTARTPIGKAFRGIFNDTHGADMGAHVIKHAAQRANLDLGDVIPIHDLMLSPGATSESCAFFIGRVDTTNAGGVFGLESEAEDILVKVVPFAEARAMLDRGEIDNAIAVIALQWLALHRDEVRSRWL